MANQAGVRAGRAFIEVGVDDRLTAGLKKAQARVKRFGDSVRRIGANLAKVSAVSATPFILSLNSFSKFEKALAGVKASLQASNSVTSNQFALLTKRARDLGKATVLTATDAARGMEILARSGQTVNEILGSIAPAIDLAVAGNLDIAESTGIATKVLRSMGLQVSELGRAMDVLTKIMSSSLASIEDVGETMKLLGPNARLAGVNLNELAAVFQTFANGSILGTRAGTTARSMLASLVDVSPKAQKALEGIGFTVEGGIAQFGDLADFIERAKFALRDFSPRQRLGLLSRIFERRALPGIALLVNQGADQFRKLTKNAEDSRGILEQFAKTIKDTLAGSVLITISKITDLAIEIGGALAPAVRAALTVFGEFTDKITAFARDNAGLIGTIVAAVAATFSLGAGLIGLGIAIQIAAFGIGTLASITGAFAAAVLTILSPVGLFGASLVALGISIASVSRSSTGFVDTVMAAFRDAVGFVARAMSGMADAVSAGRLDLAAELLWANLTLIWFEGVGALTAIWDDFLLGWRLTMLDAAGKVLEGFSKVQIFLKRLKGDVELGLKIKTLDATQRLQVAKVKIRAASARGDVRRQTERDVANVESGGKASSLRNIAGKVKSEGGDIPDDFVRRVLQASLNGEQIKRFFAEPIPTTKKGVEERAARFREFLRLFVNDEINAIRKAVQEQKDQAVKDDQGPIAEINALKAELEANKEGVKQARQELLSGSKQDAIEKRKRISDAKQRILDLEKRIEDIKVRKEAREMQEALKRRGRQERRAFNEKALLAKSKEAAARIKPGGTAGEKSRLAQRIFEEALKRQEFIAGRREATADAKRAVRLAKALIRSRERALNKAIKATGLTGPEVLDDPAVITAAIRLADKQKDLARAERQLADAEKAQKNAGVVDLDAIAKAVLNAKTDVFGALQKGVSSFGTFNPFATRGIAERVVVEKRIAKATEKTANILAAIQKDNRDRDPNTGLVFA